MNYMAVKIASDVQRPDAIKFWIDREPVENEWWFRIKELVQICRIDMPGEFGGTKITHPQYQSDVTRLQILYREGGIYLDTDMFLLHPLEFWVRNMQSSLVLSKEPGGTSLCNALMIAPAGSEFVKVWLDEMPKALKSDIWANGGVNLPYRLASLNDDWVSVLDSDYFCPLDLSRTWLFDTDAVVIGAGEKLVENSFSVHAYETYWRDYVGHVTPEWIEKNDCLFARKFSHHLTRV